jgi:hypothetical protein
LTQRLEGSGLGNEHSFNNIEPRSLIKRYFLPGKAPKDFHDILKETLRKEAPSFATVKNWVPQFKSRDFPPVRYLVLDDPKQ